MTLKIILWPLHTCCGFCVTTPTHINNYTHTPYVHTHKMHATHTHTLLIVICITIFLARFLVSLWIYLRCLDHSCSLPRQHKLPSPSSVIWFPWQNQSSFRIQYFAHISVCRVVIITLPLLITKLEWNVHQTSECRYRFNLRMHAHSFLLQETSHTNLRGMLCPQWYIHTSFCLGEVWSHFSTASIKTLIFFCLWLLTQRAAFVVLRRCWLLLIPFVLVFCCYAISYPKFWLPEAVIYLPS